MVDAIEFRLTNTTILQPEFRALQARYQDTWRHHITRKSFPYQYSVDLRPFDLPFHFHHRDRYHYNDKLTVYDPASFNSSELLSQLAKIVRSNPEHLQVMRLDLAVDLRDYPVSWFWKHVRVLYKQTMEEDYGAQPLNFSHSVLPGGVETLYYGRRPNCIRIYDKAAQTRYRLRRQPKNATPLLRQANHRLSLQYAAFSGNDRTPWTRIERQFGGGRLPEGISTLGDFLATASTIDPFEPVQFICGLPDLPDKSSMKPLKFAKGIGIRYMRDLYGMQETARYLNSAGRHGPDALRTYAAFLGDDHVIPAPDLFQLFQQSLTSQLNDSPTSESFLPGDQEVAESLTLLPDAVRLCRPGPPSWVN